MKSLTYVIRAVIILCVIVLSNSVLSGQDSLNDHLAPLKVFTGKTWKGQVGETADLKPVIDISKWERILNGNGIRILHSVNNGDYGGETIITWDNEKQSLIFYYFTTGGFYTHGITTIDGDRMISRESVTGNEGGITEVESTIEITEDGKMLVKTRLLKNGDWSDESSHYYIEDPTAEVIFH